MNKTQLIDAVAAKTGLKKKDADEAVAAVLDAVAEALAAGEKVQLIGFGTFSVNQRPEREGINPSTKEKITIKAKNCVKFKVGAELDNAVNK